MAEIALTKSGRDMRSVFDLLGRGEVDLTAALAWTLTHSPALMSALWQRLGLPGEPERADLEVTGNEGRTDLEIVGTEASAIVEAKKGWLVPGETQLSKYINHFTGGGERLFVTLSDSDPAWAATHLVDRIAGIPVRHLSWAQVRSDIATARASTRISTERHWLHEMNTYLPAATAERDPANQWVFCVVVSNNSPGAGTTTFRQYVERERIYFHPFGKAPRGGQSALRRSWRSVGAVRFATWPAWWGAASSRRSLTGGRRSDETTRPRTFRMPCTNSDPTSRFLIASQREAPTPMLGCGPCSTSCSPPSPSPRPQRTARSDRVLSAASVAPQGDLPLVRPTPKVIATGDNA